MRYITADMIFPVHRPAVANGVLIIEPNGKILDLLDPLINDISDSIPLENYQGVICPGFVNAHCHLELSHLAGKFTTGKGLSTFIGEMIEKRDGDNYTIQQSIVDADREMYEEGIVAVGDISNSTVSLNQKLKSKIHYHTFIEIFDIFPERATEVFNNGLNLMKTFSEAGLISSLVPHAPYTVSRQLMKMISDNAISSKSPITIHNQETFSENEMFQKGTGILIDKLRQISKSFLLWQPTGKTSLSSWIDLFDKDVTFQLVHNTFSGFDDIRMAIQKIRHLYWCLCVKANLFIENTLPDIQQLSDEGCKITIGTDSYASNNSLSILSELKTIGKNFPEIELTEMLKWATLNGAEFLEVDKTFGSFEVGKTPGINLISNLNVKNCRLTEASRIQRIY